MLLSLAFGFLLGVVAVLVAEGLTLYQLWRRLSGKRREKAEPDGSVERGFVSGLRGDYPNEKQGLIWILDEDAFVKRNGADMPVKGTKESKNKKGIIEVSPVKRRAKIKGHSLILTDEDGGETTIILLDCSILAVSASDQPSRKWYKKYPIKVESNDAPIYNGKRICYLYAETSTEKESWCRALRLASSSDEDTILKNSLLHEEFYEYLVSLMVQHPLFLKPTSLSSEVTGNDNKVDGSSSRVRHLLRKLTKKVSKIGGEHKASCESFSSRRDGKSGEKSCNNQDASLNGSSRSSSGKSFVEDVNHYISPYGTILENQQGDTYDANADEELDFDEGTLCLNLFFSRIFFDAKKNSDIRHSLEARLQRSLSNIRTPSYIGGISCTSFDLGNVPPYIQNIRALPVDMNEMLAVDIDINYSGGFLLDIETRIDVRGPEIQKGFTDTNSEPTTMNVTSGNPEGLECHNNNLMHSTDSSNSVKEKDEEGKLDDSKQSKSSSWASAYKSRVKMILNSVADHVYQVPLSLSIKVASLRGTLRLHIKPPPSDQWWFAFTSMPEIELNLDSSVGDRKFFNTHVGVLITNRIKSAFREALVLPNCEGFYIPWMLAEKNDWVPRNIAPFMWVHPENSSLPSKESSNLQTKESNSNVKAKRCFSADNIEDSFAKANNNTLGPPVLEPVTYGIDRTSSLPPRHISESQALDDLKMPLLKNDGFQDDCDRGRLEFLESSTSTPVLAGQIATLSEVNTGVRRMGKRDRMISLGRRVSEKFEEKKRHMEEKGRNLVEKMKENTK